MRKVTLFIVIFLYYTVSYAQNAYYDAISLKEFLISNVFNSEEKSNKQQDSVEVLRDSIAEKRREFQNRNQDSLTKYTRLGKELDSTLNIILESKDDSLFTLLQKYFPEITESSTSAEVTAIIKQNPFFENFSVQGVTRSAGSPVKKIGLSGILASASGLDVTNIANALSSIMIERAKQELTVAFFNRFK